MSNQGALANLDDNAAIAELSGGTLMHQIAERYHCSKVAIYKRLSKHPEYPEAIRQQATSLVERATAEVFECDAATVNIARARVDAAHKWAAARDPAHWSPQRGQVQVNVAVVADERLTERLSGLLDKIAVQQSDNEIQDVS